MYAFSQPTYARLQSIYFLVIIFCPLSNNSLFWHTLRFLSCECRRCFPLSSHSAGGGFWQSTGAIFLLLSSVAALILLHCKPFRPVRALLGLAAPTEIGSIRGSSRLSLPRPSMRKRIRTRQREEEAPTSPRRPSRTAGFEMASARPMLPNAPPRK